MRTPIIKFIARAVVASAVLSLAAPDRSIAQTWVSTGPGGAAITALALDHWTPSTIYASTATDGVFKSIDGARTWQHAGLATVEIRSLAVDILAPSTIYAGTVRYGLLKSVDGGATWQARNNGIMDREVKAIAIEPWTGTLYMSAGGVLKSTNGGDSWSLLNDGIVGSVETLVIDLWKPSTVYAGTEGQGVFRTDNGGVSWYPLRDGLPGPVSPATYPSVYGLVLDPWLSDTVLFSAFHGSTYLSASGGRPWTAISDVPDRVRVLTRDPIVHTTLYAGSSTGGVLKSADSGRHWLAINGGLTSRNVVALVVDPKTPSTLYAGTKDRGVFKSTDAGATWSPANAGIHSTPVSLLTVDPWSGAVYAAGIAGLHRTVDHGRSWVALNDTLINATPEDGLGWASLDALAVDPWTPTTMYAGLTGRGLLKTADGGRTWIPTAFDDAETAIEIALDPYYPDTLYVIARRGPYRVLYRSRDGGASIEELPGDHENVALDPRNPAVIYTTNNVLTYCGPPLTTCFRNYVSRSTDYGATFETHSGPGSVYKLVTHHSSPDVIYAGLATGGVARSVDGGASWTTSNEGLELPTTPRILNSVHDLVVDPKVPSTLYAGTRYGVYKSVDSGDHWSQLPTEGLSNWEVLSIAVDSFWPNIIYAGTATRGVFVLDQRQAGP